MRKYEIQKFIQENFKEIIDEYCQMKIEELSDLTIQELSTKLTELDFIGSVEGREFTEVSVYLKDEEMSDIPLINEEDIPF